VIVADAPGKLMLAGEYAVVNGMSPALAVALSVRVRVTIKQGGRHWRVSSPGLGLVEAEPEAVPVIAAALEGFTQPPAHIVVESELGAGAEKPGFGASAAVTVAVLGGLHYAAGKPAPTVSEVVDVHRRGQKGHGSGYDVATSLLGGVVVYENLKTGPRAKALGWLPGLHGAIIFTGRGARTTAHLSRLERAKMAPQGDSFTAMEAHSQVSQALVDAWVRQDVAAFLAAAETAERALERLDEACSLGIGQGGVSEARTAIFSSGAVARTSGAGGGDCMWALGPDAATVKTAIAAAESLGYQCLELGYAAPGLAVADVANGK
jgi:phosphomevalonate kinase